MAAPTLRGGARGRVPHVPQVQRAAEDRAGARVAARPETIAQLCREHDISESLLRKWREQFLAAGAERLSGRQERTEADELRRQVSRLERALGRKTMEVQVAGELLRGWE
jgi:transposase